MISALTGLLVNVGDERVRLAIGPIVCDVLVPRSDVPTLEKRLGEAVTFHTLLYLEGDAAGGNLTPRLLGFAEESDKRFFEKFITVKSIGPRKALRALTVPVGQIAAAIEAKDARPLSALPGIGKRTAEQVVAELSGKVGEFIKVIGTDGPSRPGPTEEPHVTRPAADMDAIRALTILGERQAEAERLLDQVRRRTPALTSTADLVRDMLRLRGTER